MARGGRWCGSATLGQDEGVHEAACSETAAGSGTAVGSGTAAEAAQAQPRSPEAQKLILLRRCHSLHKKTKKCKIFALGEEIAKLEAKQ